MDDEPQVTKAIGRILNKEGYEVIELNEPRKVEEYILYTDLSLIITDLNMPKMNGMDVLKLVKESKPNLPVIFLTGVTDLQAAVEAAKSGAAEYLTKPIDARKLKTFVEKHASVEHVLPDEVQQLINNQFSLDEPEGTIEPSRLLLTNEIISTDTIPEGYVELKFNDIVPGQVLPFSFYIQILNKNTQKYYLRKICQKNTVFTSGLKGILDKRNLSSVYIRREEYASYLEYIKAIKSMPNFAIRKVADQKKLLLYGKAIEAVSEILTDPIGNENIKSGISLVDSMFQTMVKDPITYNDLFKLFQKDDTIFNHSANVCLLSVSFGIYLNLDPKRIRILGLGSLFHDLGMNAIDKKILVSVQGIDLNFRQPV